ASSSWPRWSTSRSRGGKDKTMQALPPSGPTILGLHVIYIATILSAVATVPVMLALYAATPVQDPTARRAKARNERRAQSQAIILLYGMDMFPAWSALRRYITVAGVLVGSYKAPDIWLKNKVNKRSHAIRKGLPDALDLLVICAEAGLTVDAAFGRVSRELGK